MRGGQDDVLSDILSQVDEEAVQGPRGHQQAERFIRAEARTSQGGSISPQGPISIHLLLQPHPELKTLDPKPFAEIKAMGLFADGSGDQLNLGAVQGFGFGA